MAKTVPTDAASGTCVSEGGKTAKKAFLFCGSARLKNSKKMKVGRLSGKVKLGRKMGRAKGKLCMSSNKFRIEMCGCVITKPKRKAKKSCM